MTGQEEEVVPSFQRGDFIGDLYEGMQIREGALESQREQPGKCGSKWQHV